MHTDETLIGEWITDPSDLESLREYGQVSLRFTPSGELLYTIHGPDKDEVIILTYQVKRGVLVTDQPSTPRRDRTRYELTPDGKLVLYYGGSRTSYIRA